MRNAPSFTEGAYKFFVEGIFADGFGEGRSGGAHQRAVRNIKLGDSHQLKLTLPIESRDSSF